MNERDRLMKEIFESIDVIAKQRVEDASYSSSIVGTIIERIRSSDMYRISYQGQEIRAMSMGASYDQGDTVIILIPDKRMDELKFILGRDNDRTPTISQGTTGLSQSILDDIQRALDAVADMSSDGKITPSEKKSLLIEWEDVKASYKMLMRESEIHGVPTDELTERYDSLESIMSNVFRDMNETSTLPGETLTKRFGAFYSENQNVHQKILESIANRVSMKVEIDSTNGNHFRNGNIETTLIASVYRGERLVTDTLHDHNFIWKKFDSKGIEDVGWREEKVGVGKEVSIGPEDVQYKATFSCEISID